MLKIFLPTFYSDQPFKLAILLTKLIPVDNLSTLELGPTSNKIVSRYIGKINLNSFLPCIPKIFHKAILSEQLKLKDFLCWGKSNLPGFVLRILG